MWQETGKHKRVGVVSVIEDRCDGRIVIGFVLGLGLVLVRYVDERQGRSLRKRSRILLFLFSYFQYKYV